MRQMDIGEYIKKKKKDLNKSARYIKNAKVFEFNYWQYYNSWARRYNGGNVENFKEIQAWCGISLSVSFSGKTWIQGYWATDSK